MLEVAAGFKLLYLFVESVGTSTKRPVKALGSISVRRPSLIEHVGDCYGDQTTDFLCLRSVAGQRAVEQNKIGRHLRDFGALHIMRTFRRCDQKGENEGRHRPYQAHPQLYHI